MPEVVTFPKARLDPSDRQIADWLHRTRAQMDVSFSAWARRAGVSDTSVTRFLKHGRPVPKVATLERLAIAAGVPPPHVGGLTAVAIRYIDIPVMNARIAAVKGWDVARMNAVETTRAPEKFQGCGGFRLSVDTGSRLGLNVGDLVVVDPTKVPGDQSLVVVAMSDGTCGAMLHQGGALIPCGSADVDLAGARILGVAVQMQRDLG